MLTKEAVAEICKAKIKSFTKAATDKYQVQFNVAELTNPNNEVFKAIVAQCQKKDVRAMGARGIGKEVNKIFNGSLSEHISKFILENRKNELVNKTLTCELTQEFIQNEDQEKVLTQKHINWK